MSKQPRKLKSGETKITEKKEQQKRFADGEQERVERGNKGKGGQS